MHSLSLVDHKIYLKG
ncbi:MAG: hypothetical protein L6263_06850 [Desulfobacteraceae bacterium]|nr:hypothetical protein [Desulfobacteraceae bacterium]